MKRLKDNVGANCKIQLNIGFRDLVLLVKFCYGEFSPIFVNDKESKWSPENFTVRDIFSNLLSGLRLEINSYSQFIISKLSTLTGSQTVKLICLINNQMEPLDKEIAAALENGHKRKADNIKYIKTELKQVLLLCLNNLAVLSKRDVVEVDFVDLGVELLEIFIKKLATKDYVKIDLTPNISTITSRISSLFTACKTNILTNFICKVGTVEFATHKCILSARSEFFKVSCANGNAVEIFDLSPSAFNLLLEFIYTANFAAADLLPAQLSQICSELIPKLNSFGLHDADCFKSLLICGLAGLPRKQTDDD